MNVLLAGLGKKLVHGGAIHILTYIHTYMYIHTYIYIHTCIHTYLHAYMRKKNGGTVMQGPVSEYTPYAKQST